MRKKLLFFFIPILFSPSLFAQGQKNFSFEEIRNLEKLENIVVVSKKFLERTGRFQGIFGSSIVTNSPAVFNLGPEFGLGYYFTEKIGASVFLAKQFSSDRQIVKGLRKHTIGVSQIYAPDVNYGVSLRWLPVYGKMAIRNEKISSFENFLDFTVGQLTGKIGGKKQKNNFFALSLGQETALGKDASFYWKFSWARSNYKLSVANLATAASVSNDDLSVSVGMTWYLTGKR